MDNKRYVLLRDASPRILRDLVTPTRVDQLNRTLAPHLKLDLPPLPSPAINDVLPPAYHFLFFLPSTSEADSLPDGYESHFAPKKAFGRRLWTQGIITYPTSREGLKLGQWAVCKESLIRVAELPKRKDEVLTDVWVKRKMYAADDYSEDIDDEDEDEDEDVDDDDKWTVNNKLLAYESRCLRYLTRSTPRCLPTDSISSLNSVTGGRYLRARRRAFLRHTFRPTHLLLTRFLQLTFNVHKIHHDIEYAQKSELWPDILIPGSLTVTLVLTLIRQYYAQSRPELRIRSVKYSLFQPLYVDQRIELTVEEEIPTGRIKLEAPARYHTLWTVRPAEEVAGPKPSKEKLQPRHRAKLWTSNHRLGAEFIIEHMRR
jgi:hydroxyacyl-ACP dehydratase HTD2-like protein with hotdog domain